MRLQKDFISIQFSGRLVQILHCARRKVGLVVVELAHWDGVLCYLFQTLRESLFDFDGFVEVFTLFQRAVRT